MAIDITYDWKINSIEYQPTLEGFTDFVVFVSATYVGKTQNAVSYREFSVKYYPESGQSIIPLESILADKSIVVGWLESSNDMQQIEQDMYNEIYSYLNPSSVVVGNPYND